MAIVQIKTLGAGTGNLLLTLASGAHLPSGRVLLPCALVGFISYGLSIVLDVYALRLIGAAREAAFFATAPFVGALVAVPLLAEPLRSGDLAGAVLMANGIGLLIRYRSVEMPMQRESA